MFNRNSIQRNTEKTEQESNSAIELLLLNKKEKTETASKMKLKTVFICHIYCNDCHNNLLVCARQINTYSTGCNDASCRLPGLRPRISSHPQQRDQTQNNAFPIKQPSVSWCYIPQATQLPEVMERAQRRRWQKYSPRTAGVRVGACTQLKVYFPLGRAKHFTYSTANVRVLLNRWGWCLGVTVSTHAHPQHWAEWAARTKQRSSGGKKRMKEQLNKAKSSCNTF